MDKKSLIINYIQSYRNHFKNDKRNDATFEALQYAGYLLDKYYPEFTKDATYYEALYKKCLLAENYTTR